MKTVNHSYDFAVDPLILTFYRLFPDRFCAQTCVPSAPNGFECRGFFYKVSSDFIWDFGKLPFPTHLGKYFIKIGKIRAKIHEIGKIKAIFGLGMTPIYHRHIILQCPQVSRRARFSDPYCFWPT